MCVPCTKVDSPADVWSAARANPEQSAEKVLDIEFSRFVPFSFAAGREVFDFAQFERRLGCIRRVHAVVAQARVNGVAHFEVYESALAGAFVVDTHAQQAERLVLRSGHVRESAFSVFGVFPLEDLLEAVARALAVNSVEDVIDVDSTHHEFITWSPADHDARVCILCLKSGVLDVALHAIHAGSFCECGLPALATDQRLDSSRGFDVPGRNGATDVVHREVCIRPVQEDGGIEVVA